MTGVVPDPPLELLGRHQDELATHHDLEEGLHTPLDVSTDMPSDVAASCLVSV